MNRWTQTLVLTAFIAAALMGGCPSESGNSGAGESPAVDSAVATGLLDAYVEELRLIASQGTVVGLDEAIAELSKRNDAALAGGKVSPEFHRRFARLVRLTGRMIEPPGSPDALAQTERELAAFVADVEGSQREVDPKGGLAEVSPALMEEVLRLHESVGGAGARAAAKKKYEWDAGLHPPE